MLRAWVALWDRRETGESLAIVRILLPLVLLYDLSEVASRGLVVPLWGPIEEGGIGPASHAEPVCAFYAWLGASASTAWMLFGIATTAALSLCLGLFSRASALVLLLAYAQLAQLSPDADRGIDTLLRNVLAVLTFARAGATLSVDAWRAHGRLVTNVLVPAWPRYLIVTQLVLLYFSAGVLKQSSHWSYRSGYDALLLVLQKPHFVRFALSRELLLSAAPLLSVGTLVTVTWERCALLLPLLLFLRGSAARGGLLRRWVNRLRLLELWVMLGVVFHLSLAALLQLGMFPFGCLALYPALAAPRTLRSVAARIGARIAPYETEAHATRSPITLV